MLKVIELRLGPRPSGLQLFNKSNKFYGSPTVLFLGYTGEHGGICPCHHGALTMEGNYINEKITHIHYIITLRGILQKRDHKIEIISLVWEVEVSELEG